MNQKIDEARLYRFYLWVSKPRGVSNLNTILHHLTDHELLHLIQKHHGEPAGKIAWAEYGRRHKYADIRFTMREMNLLEVEAKDFVLVSGLGEPG